MISPWNASALCLAPPTPAPRPAPSLVKVSGFSEQVDTKDLSGPHTIKDAAEYMEHNLGPETLGWVKEGRPITIAVGEGRKTLEHLKESGWTLGEPVDKEVGFHQVRHAKDPEGKSQLLI